VYFRVIKTEQMPSEVIPWIGNSPPEIGSRVKVWFDKRSGDLIIETALGAKSRDIYGVCLSDAIFGTEKTPRGAVSCFVVGTFMAVPGSNESHEIKRAISARGGKHLDFYWWKNKDWPITTAALALIAKPHGGFPTCYAVSS